MMHSRLPYVCLLLACFGNPWLGQAAGAKPENWVTKQGEKFRGTPADVLGPFALFLTDKKSGKRVLLRNLSEEDCVRFARRIADRPERAARWSHAQASATREVVGNVRRLVDGKFSLATFDDIPEPEFLMLLFLTNDDDQRSLQAGRDFLPEYQRVRARFPGRAEAVYIGARHDETNHHDLARELAMPWLIESFRSSDEMRSLREYLPGNPPTLMILSRTGVPISFSNCKTQSDIERAVLEFEALLSLMRPGDKRAWPERLYFYRTVRLASFQTGRADPLLVGHLLDLDALRAAGIQAVDARLTVSAEGQVTEASVAPASGITVEVAQVLRDALLQSPMVPAIENGRFVAGTCELRLEP